LILALKLIGSDYYLLEVYFNSKADAISFFQGILYRYSVGDKVTSADGKILADALARHPDASEKVGAGVASFSVRSADFGTRCFWVNRTDGSSEKFSFRACLR